MLKPATLGGGGFGAVVSAAVEMERQRRAYEKAKQRQMLQKNELMAKMAQEDALRKEVRPKGGTPVAHL